ncbi:hypothetical protein ACFOUP_07175 [Belliella kenyensis]|uniref:Uncharacterized protein n=1 Tax=Belliella kenyensis TaxID=1472724 RepID=A0ABV8EIN2_9BACT|nr:hypothetical protein [Belliella kenyensis]MCH7400253.1 hypothetical protein [Belliella kenyensis]MDN3604730.1 hypothetical protein [Belliella kenyensis]
MQEVWTFGIDPKEEFKTNEDLIKKQVELNQKELGIMLSYYYKSQGAVVEQVKFISTMASMEDNTAKVMLGFAVIHFNACLNIHDQKQERIEIQVKVVENEITFIGPEIMERGMDEI